MRAKSICALSRRRSGQKINKRRKENQPRTQTCITAWFHSLKKKAVIRDGYLKRAGGSSSITVKKKGVRKNSNRFIAKEHTEVLFNLV